jgi:hypothetical protein
MKLVYVPDYQNVFTKNQSKNAKMTIVTDLSIELSFEPSKIESF